VVRPCWWSKRVHTLTRPMSILLARTPADIVACLEAGDPVDSKHPVTGECALLLAAQRCDVEAARLLVQSGADPVGSGALRKALDLQDVAMTRALLHPLPVFDQLCYWRQLVWSCALTGMAATLRRWPLYGLPSEVLVAHKMPACAENTLFFCFPDEFGHLKQGIALAKRALQRGYAVDFMSGASARQAAGGRALDPDGWERAAEHRPARAAHHHRGAARRGAHGGRSLRTN